MRAYWESELFLGCRELRLYAFLVTAGVKAYPTLQRIEVDCVQGMNAIAGLRGIA
ncbi:hypothetical protein D3C81_2202250 [compost metagenome]